MRDDDYRGRSTRARAEASNDPPALLERVEYRLNTRDDLQIDPQDYYEELVDDFAKFKALYVHLWNDGQAPAGSSGWSASKLQAEFKHMDDELFASIIPSRSTTEAKRAAVLILLFRVLVASWPDGLDWDASHDWHRTAKRILDRLVDEFLPILETHAKQQWYVGLFRELDGILQGSHRAKTPASATGDAANANANANAASAASSSSSSAPGAFAKRQRPALEALERERRSRLDDHAQQAGLRRRLASMVREVESAAERARAFQAGFAARADAARRRERDAAVDRSLAAIDDAVREVRALGDDPRSEEAVEGAREVMRRVHSELATIASLTSLASAEDDDAEDDDDVEDEPPPEPDDGSSDALWRGLAKDDVLKNDDMRSLVSYHAGYDCDNAFEGVELYSLEYGASRSGMPSGRYMASIRASERILDTLREDAFQFQCPEGLGLQLGLDTILVFTREIHLEKTAPLIRDRNNIFMKTVQAVIRAIIAFLVQREPYSWYRVEYVPRPFLSTTITGCLFCPYDRRLRDETERRLDVALKPPSPDHP